MGETYNQLSFFYFPHKKRDNVDIIMKVTNVDGGGGGVGVGVGVGVGGGHSQIVNAPPNACPPHACQISESLSLCNYFGEKIVLFGDANALPPQPPN